MSRLMATRSSKTGLVDAFRFKGIALPLGHRLLGWDSDHLFRAHVLHLGRRIYQDHAEQNKVYCRKSSGLLGGTKWFVLFQTSPQPRDDGSSKLR